MTMDRRDGDPPTSWTFSHGDNIFIGGDAAIPAKPSPVERTEPEEPKPSAVDGVAASRSQSTPEAPARRAIVPDIVLELPSGWRWTQRHRLPLGLEPVSESGALQISSPPSARSWRGSDLTAACQTRSTDISPVIRAAYPSAPERAAGATRWSVTDDEIERALAQHRRRA